jgi:hypothetical protein
MIFRVAAMPVLRGHKLFYFFIFSMVAITSLTLGTSGFCKFNSLIYILVREINFPHIISRHFIFRRNFQALCKIFP